MSNLIAALRAKFKTPQEAVAALGLDATIMSAAEEEKPMNHILTRKAAFVHGAVAAMIKPKIATDSKMPDLSGILAKVTAKNFSESKAKIAADIKTAVAGKIAKDASIEDIADLLDSLEDVEIKEEDKPADGAPPAEDDGSPLEKIRALLVELSDEDKAALKSALGMDEGDGDKDRSDAEEKAKREETEKQDREKEKAAMDARIAAAVKTAHDAAVKTQSEIRDAERAVRPYIGELSIACDSAEAVYRTALAALGVDVKDVHATALPVILSMQPKAGARERANNPVAAMDAASAKSYADRFPNANRLKK